MRSIPTDWAHSPDRPARRSLQMATLGRDILAAADPAIQVIWVNGTNVVNQALDSRQIAKAFAQVPFKVVVDAFLTDDDDINVMISVYGRPGRRLYIQTYDPGTGRIGKLYPPKILRRMLARQALEAM